MKVLVVEDSQTVRTYIEAILRSAPDIVLLPPARDGITAVELAQTHRPDVILMDLELPRMSGIEAIREIMSTAPKPIIVLSGTLDEKDSDRTFASFNAGAVEVLAKPHGLSKEAQERFSDRLLRTVRLMSEARVLRRSSLQSKKSRPPQLESAPPLEPTDPTNYAAIEIVLIAASTGGPQVVRNIFDEIPTPFPLPIILCQHIVPGFEEGLAHWLSQSGHDVRLARNEEVASARRIYVARADKHLVLNGSEIMFRTPVGKRVVPSADVLFDSAARTLGRRCAAFLLTGMGEDGGQGLLALKQQGALTVTQSAATCTIDGMPKAARNLDASLLDLSPKRIVELLKRLADSKRTI